jgi:hypothetical protein
MGFREFSCFNQALLARQLWRLWKKPKSLIAMIMKAKYFRSTGEVLDANLGSKPSYAGTEGEGDWQGPRSPPNDQKNKKNLR